MPQIQPKEVQGELQQGLLWPVYWLHGKEPMKARELLRRIRNTTLGEDCPAGSLAEEFFDGTETTSGSILDSAQSPAMGGGIRLIIIKGAQSLKEAELLAPLLGPRAPASDLHSVCVFVSDDLDRRKKFTKLLLEKAAVVSCEEVPDGDREAWVQYLAKRREMKLSGEMVAHLRSMDPWSLDMVERELEKISLAHDPADGLDVLSGQTEGEGGSQAFLDAFFTRNLKNALNGMGHFAAKPDQAIPLLGLMAWHLRHLIILVLDPVEARNSRLNPYLMDRFRRWTPLWTSEELEDLQRALAEVDFQMKQTARSPLGIWGELIQRFCKMS